MKIRNDAPNHLRWKIRSCLQLKGIQLRIKLAAALGGLLVALLFTTSCDFASSPPRPYFVPAGVSIPNSACRVNLRLIQPAKEMWANEHKKGPADVPQYSDLIGPDKYLRAKSVCPLDGTYRLGAVREKPTCSFGASNPGHTFEFNR